GSPQFASTTRSNAFNGKGDVLIADQWNNRIVEVDKGHHIVWQFGSGSAKAGPASVVGPNDAERYGDLTLIAATGLPAGTIPACSKKPCQDNRVIVVNKAGKIVWQYGKTGIPGSKPGLLNAPVSAVHLKNGDVLVTDQGNQRVVEISMSKRIVWQYGTTAKSGAGPNELKDPNSAQMLSNGNVLIADESNNRVIEVTNAGKIVWQYGKPKDTKLLNGVGFASRLPNGNTLVTDSGHSRIVEVSSTGSVVWSFVTNKQSGSIGSPQPSHAVRLKNGNTLIANQIDNEVIEVDNAGHIVWQQGKVAKSGTKFDELNWPYDAKRIGDFTGLTPP
ncbi:MAG TPA: hypothetical protein VFE36_12680, partial [Candidatus Baltobacteraceae bacterium]|nr:hypothetical protein [Candidatus Baltobacteraceae bacterium]